MMASPSLVLSQCFAAGMLSQNIAADLLTNRNGHRRNLS